MVMVRVVMRAHAPKSVVADAETEHPVSTKLLVVVHEDNPGSGVMHDTK